MLNSFISASPHDAVVLLPRCKDGAATGSSGTATGTGARSAEAVTRGARRVGLRRAGALHVERLRTGLI